MTYVNSESWNQFLQQIFDTAASNQPIDLHKVFQAANALTRKYIEADVYENEKELLASAETLLKLMPIITNELEQLIERKR